MTKSDAILLIAFAASAIGAVSGWFAQRNTTSELDSTATEFRECQKLAGQIQAAKATPFPYLVVSPERDLSKWSLDFLENNGAKFGAEVFASELPPTPIQGSDMEQVLVSVPAIILTLPQLSSILESASNEEYPVLITRIQLQNAGLRSEDQAELWKTSLGLAFVRQVGDGN